MDATTLFHEIQRTTQALEELETALAARFDPGEVVTVCEAKVRRLRRDLVRFQHRSANLPA